MASTKFLEKDLTTDFDEFTVSTTVDGSSDTNLMTVATEVNEDQHEKSPQPDQMQQQHDNIQLHLTKDNNTDFLDSDSDKNCSSAIVLNGHTTSAINESNSDLTNNNNNHENSSNKNLNESVEKTSNDSIDFSKSDNDSSVLANLATSNESEAAITAPENTNTFVNNQDDSSSSQTISQQETQQQQASNLDTPVVSTPSLGSPVASVTESAQPSSDSVVVAASSSPKPQHIKKKRASPIVQQPRLVQQTIPPQTSAQAAMSKNNEPVKLVYPSKIPNGTINLATISSQQPQPNIMHTSTSMATNSGTNSVTAQQPQTIVIKNQALSKVTRYDSIQWRTVITTTSSVVNPTTTRSRESLTTNQLPPVASVAPVTHTIAHQVTSQPQQHIQTQQVNVPNAVSVNVSSSTTPHANLHNTKEKCRKFLSNLLDLSSREPKSVAQSVQELIQELIDAKVEPDEFCNRLERLLNASPQPCLIGFLKKSLPLLRQSLCTKELSIGGIRPPHPSVAFSFPAGNMPPQIRPVVSVPVQGVRMVQQTTRPTMITRQAAPVRVRLGEPNGGAISTTVNVPRMVNSSQIRAPGGTAIIQQHPANVQIQSHPPALHPVNQHTFTPGGAQIRAANVPIGRSAPTTVQIRHTTAENGSQILQHNVKMAKVTSHGTMPTLKVGATQIKPIINTSHPQAPQPVILTQPIVTDTSKLLMKDVPTIIPTTPVLNSSATVVNATHQTSASTAPPKMVPIKSQSSAAASKNTVASKEKERKATASFYQQSSMSAAIYGDDDINDVAAMGGVNLAEESQRILGSTELIGRQIRSCKDEILLHLPALQAKIRNIVARHGLEEPSNEVAVLVSHACQERLKNIVEKLAVIAEHRIDVIKIDPRYEITKDVRGQIKFLEELDKAEQKRHEEQEREMLMRAAKSRSKTEDPEQAKLKAKAKEMQRAELEEVRQRDANLTALQAIGPRKKPKLELDAAAASSAGGSSLGLSGPTLPLRPRIKRVNLRDMIFFLEQERDTCRGTMLYKAYLK